MRVRHSRSWRAALLVLVIATLLVGGAAYRNWSTLESTAAWYTRLYRFRTDGDPIQRRLAAGEIRPGDSAEVLLADLPPDRVNRHDEFITIIYGPPSVTGYTEIIARDGRIVAARDGRAIPAHDFFNTMEPSEYWAYARSRNAYILQVPEQRRNAVLAVAGFGATFDWCPAIEEPSQPEP